MKHRKLFPGFAANESLDCPDFCDPACPYNCPYPDFYFLPPPPPPPLGHHLPLFAIIIVSALAGLFLLLTYYFLIARSCCRSNRSGGDMEEEEQFAGENRVDHPVWLIATVGLRPSVINSITVCKYKKSEGLVDGTECSVCLTEFQEEETLRIMPKCNHAFHIPCIDTWLTSHTNCPLCRATIVSETTGGTAGENQETPATDSANVAGVAGAEDEAEVVETKEGVNCDENGDEIQQQQQPLRSLICSSCATGSGSDAGSS